jgi:hypothetical protein
LPLNSGATLLPGMHIVTFDGEDFAIDASMLRTGRKRTVGKTVKQVGGVVGLVGILMQLGYSPFQIAFFVAGLPCAVVACMTAAGLSGKWASARMAGVVIPAVCKDVDIAFWKVLYHPTPHTCTHWYFDLCISRTYSHQPRTPPRPYAHALQVRKELLKGVHGRVYGARFVFEVFAPLFVSVCAWLCSFVSIAPPPPHAHTH